MKKIFLIPALLILATATSSILVAQNCDFGQTGIRPNYFSTDGNGNCIVNADVYFDLRSNDGSKYVVLHIWPVADYPNLSYSTFPSSASLAGATTIVIHHFQDHGYSHVDSVYKPDTNVQPQFAGMELQISPPDIKNNYYRFTITNVNLLVPGACDVSPFLILDVWSTESESMNVVHCYNKGMNALPVKLKAFSAKAEGQTVQLNWITAGEFSNKGFYVERRTGDGAWETVAFISSLALKGNSMTELSYAYTDPILCKGIIQYRLRQVDVNGNFEFSEVRIVKPGRFNMISIFPNPSTGNVNVAFSDPFSTYSVIIYNSDGKMVRQWQNVNSLLTTDNLQPGIYFIKISRAHDALINTYKLVVQ